MQIKTTYVTSGLVYRPSCLWEGYFFLSFAAGAAVVVSRTVTTGHPLFFLLLSTLYLVGCWWNWMHVIRRVRALQQESGPDTTTALLVRLATVLPISGMLPFPLMYAFFR